MKIILFILLISTLIYSKSIEFTQKDIEKIKNNPNKTAILKRIQNYNNLKRKSQTTIHIENSLI